MSNLVNMVMAAVLNLMSCGEATPPAQQDNGQIIEAVVEQQLQIEQNAPVIRFETENC